MSSKKLSPCTSEQWLYALVFTSRSVRACVFVLLASIFLQPVTLAFANEETTEDTNSTSTVIIEPEPEPEPEAEIIIVEENIEEFEPEAEAVPDPVTVADSDTVEEIFDSAESVIPTDTEEPEPIENQAESEQLNIEAAAASVNLATTTAPITSSSNQTATSSNESVSESTSGTSTTALNNQSENTATSSVTTASTTVTANPSPFEPVIAQTGGGGGTDSPPVFVTATSSVILDPVTTPTIEASGPALPQTEVTSTNLASTTPVATTTPVSVATTTVFEVGSSTVRNNDNFHQFGRNDCVDVGDGSFYCGRALPAAEAAVLSTQDGFYAAHDGDGDMEIFVRHDGKNTQLTFNQVDDMAPTYDGYSNTLVWHRLVQGRYQIMSYDFDNETEVQITATRENNMEPSRYGDVTVWQRWVDTNWEIVLYDGVIEKQLTDSLSHDVTPSVREEYVMWNTTTGGDTPVLQVLNIITNEITVIEDTDGVAAANPRMVLLFDTAHQNGDVITKSFDFISGKIVPVHSIPGEIPDRIPESDQTGETRALIQQKPSGAREDIAEDPALGLDEEDSLDDAFDTDDTTLVILDNKKTDTDIDVVSETQATSTAVLIPDVVITPPASSTKAE